MPNNTTPSVKKYVDYANQQIDEQAILDKYNAATVAQYNAQREQNRQAENNFYNQMYNSQNTAMDTIRQSNAAAVSTGASRGVQAANELSALLGLQNESVASATELAQANRQVAQEETAAVLENVLKAYQQAQQEKAQLVQQGIEAASVDVQQDANKVAAMQAQAQKQEADTNRASLVTQSAENGTLTYLTALQDSGVDYTGEATTEGKVSLEIALNNIGRTSDGEALKFTSEDWQGNKTAPTIKVDEILRNINAICNAYGLDADAYSDILKDFKELGTNPKVNFLWSSGDADLFKKYGIKNAGAKKDYARKMNELYTKILNQIRVDYASNANKLVDLD